MVFLLKIAIFPGYRTGIVTFFFFVLFIFLSFETVSTIMKVLHSPVAWSVVDPRDREPYSPNNKKLA